jgi:hypothetical protein
MRARLVGVVAIAAGCTAAPDQQRLPSAPHGHEADSRPVAVACGEDDAFDGATTPSIRYTYTFDDRGRMSHALGVYASGGADDTVDYELDNLDHMTHMIESRAWGEMRVEITEDFDTQSDLVAYTEDRSAPGYREVVHYAYSDFDSRGSPARGVITRASNGTAQPELDDAFSYDESGRIVEDSQTGGGGAPVVTTFTYDDAAHVITSDTPGSYHAVRVYDARGHELSYTWTGVAATAIDFGGRYDWSGDRLISATFQSGTQAAPHTLATTEIDTFRYDCGSARAARRVSASRLWPTP